MRRPDALPPPLLERLLRSPLAVSLLVFALAVLVTGALLAGLRSAIRSQDSLAFENEVLQVRDAINQRLAVTSNLLRGTAGLFDASEQVSREEFRRYVDSLDLRARYPGILGIGFTRRLEPYEVHAFEQRARAAGLADFKVWPKAPRDEYYSIEYLEPMDRRNAAALGFDMSTEPVRRAAMAAAREQRDLVASGKVTLVQEIDRHKQAGFLMYLPIHERGEPQQPGTLLGYVYSPLRAGDLLAGTRGSTKLIDYELFDGLQPDPQALLRSTIRQTRLQAPRFTVDHHIDVAGRPWLIRFHSTPALEARSLEWLMPWLALAALAASALFARLSWLQGQERLAAETAAQAERQAADALHREREWLSATLGSIGDAVVAVDAEQRVTWMNAVAERLTGWSRTDALGRPMHEVVQTASLQHEDAQGTTQPGEHGRGEVMLRARDGTQRPVDHNSAPIRTPNGEASGSVVVFRDASARRRVESTLRENDRRKDEFLAMLAHELRNPLAPISTAAALLSSPSINQGQLRDASGIIARQAKHLSELVDDLLDVSRVTRGQITIDAEVYDLRSSIDAALEQTRLALQTSGHELELNIENGPLWVSGDRTRLTQVTANLLDNAIKYTPAPGRIVLSAGHTADGVVIRVQDNGGGISARLLPHVFDLFTQGERLLDRSQGGLGIGLALVRMLVQMHGGAVRAESGGVGQGSVFTVQLPAAEGADAITRPAAPQVEEAAPLRVAVVDDNTDALDTTAMLLEVDGHRVRKFDSAEHALQAADDDPADVYILDIGLPGMNGHELARRLRAHPRTSRATLLAVSGYGQTNDVAASIDAGIHQHLVKPVDPGRLLAALRSAAPPRV
ncbi:CHASE domain-containing protein [Lysobacter korlensis]|uniref:histidine kinase n=1 Tax=Lysobacter korlensis TaxID=553636 RepID=A0ABV6RQW7_9GAMM